MDFLKEFDKSFNKISLYFGEKIDKNVFNSDLDDEIYDNLLKKMLHDHTFVSYTQKIYQYGDRIHIIENNDGKLTQNYFKLKIKENKMLDKFNIILYNQDTISSLSFPCKLDYHQSKEQSVISTKINHLELFFIEEKINNTETVKEIKIIIDNNSYIDDSVDILKSIINQ
tara:strand:+ start:54 stop:563 length:510 start_codon:yes stop_codon:yes gene_type:complete